MNSLSPWAWPIWATTRRSGNRFLNTFISTPSTSVGDHLELPTRPGELGANVCDGRHPASVTDPRSAMWPKASDRAGWRAGRSCGRKASDRAGWRVSNVAGRLAVARRGTASHEQRRRVDRQRAGRPRGGHGVGRGGGCAEPRHRCHPTGGAHRVDRCAPRGGGRVRSECAGPGLGTLGVCMGTVGPGSIHLLNGLYDAASSYALPVLAICGIVPLARVGEPVLPGGGQRSAVHGRRRLPGDGVLGVNTPMAPGTGGERGVGRAGGVSVLTLPGDVG